MTLGLLSFLDVTLVSGLFGALGTVRESDHGEDAIREHDNRDERTRWAVLLGTPRREVKP